MKIRRNIVPAMVYMMGFMLLAACAPKTAGGAPTGLAIKTLPTIKVHVVGGPKLKVQDGGNCPSTSNSFGCIDVPKGERAEVTFLLRAPGEWYFTEFRICKGTKTDKTNGTLDCKLTPPELADFTFSLDQKEEWPNKNGVVDLTKLSTDPLRDFDLMNENVVPNDYFYTIKACMPDGTNQPICAESDPPIRNKGR